MRVRFGLRLQIGLILLGLTLITALLVGLPVVNLLERGLYEQERAAAEQVTALLRHQLGSGAPTEEQLAEALAAYAHPLLVDGLLDQVMVLDEAGGRLASVPDPSGLPETTLDELSALPVRVGARLFDDERIGRLLVVDRPLTLGDGPPADALVLRVVVSAAAVASTHETARFLTVLYGLMAGLVVLIAGYLLLTRLVVVPIRRIGVAAERVAAGDAASRVALATRNELGDVADSFDRMLDRLEESRVQLEEKVDALSRAKRELEQAQAAMIRSEKLASVGQLAAGIAHEIGNPLAAVLGLVELLRDDADLAMEERLDLLARVEKELLRINDIIRELLDYSRSAGGEPDEADVADTLEHARRLVEVLPRFRGVRLTLALEAPLPRVAASTDRLQQVLVNLLLNAADAVDGEGNVTVTAEPLDEGVCVRVVDDGPGIAEADRQRLFEPFYTSKPTGQGTGLGLAICDMIVTAWGGWIRAETAERGACLSVWIPAVEES